MEEQKKSRMLMIEAMLAIIVLIFLSALALDKFFPTPTTNAISGAPGIVGFVPVEIKSQPIDITAKQTTKLVMFSEKPDQFSLTSLRLSGEVIGNGRAEIVLDNGLGQELLIYSNVKQKEGNQITGMAVDESQPLPADVKIDNVAAEQAWIKITDSGTALDETPSQSLGEDKTTTAGAFQNECLKTCYMNMKMKQGLYYTLKVRVDAGTEVKITELKYTLEV
jgi:hypothetical protein